MTTFTSFRAFTEAHPLYTHISMITYLIYQDIMLKKEVEDVSFLDGSSFQCSSYFIQGRVINSNKSRLFIPCTSEENIDLKRLTDIVQQSTASNREVFLCVANFESIVYQLVTLGIP